MLYLYSKPNKQMKKQLTLITVTLTFIFAFLFEMQSCTKESKLAPPPPVIENKMPSILNDLKIENGILVFKDRAYYDEVLTYLGSIGDEKFESFEKQIGFNSLRANLDNVDHSKWNFTDQLLFTILSPDGKIIIKDKAFRLDFEKEVGYVVDKSKVDQLNYPEQIPEVYPFEVNVLDIYYPEEPISRAGCVGGNCDQKTTVTGGETYDLKDVYQSAVVYFSLQVQIGNGVSGGNTIQACANGSYIKKNSTTSVTFNACGSTSSYVSDYRPYEASSCLSSYNCTGNFYEFAFGGTNHWTLFNNHSSCN